MGVEFAWVPSSLVLTGFSGEAEAGAEGNVWRWRILKMLGLDVKRMQGIDELKYRVENLWGRATDHQ